MKIGDEMCNKKASSWVRKWRQWAVVPDGARRLTTFSYSACWTLIKIGRKHFDLFAWNKCLRFSLSGCEIEHWVMSLFPLGFASYCLIFSSRKGDKELNVWEASAALKIEFKYYFFRKFAFFPLLSSMRHFSLILSHVPSWISILPKIRPSAASSRYKNASFLPTNNMQMTHFLCVNKKLPKLSFNLSKLHELLFRDVLGLSNGEGTAKAHTETFYLPNRIARNNKSEQTAFYKYFAIVQSLDFSHMPNSVIEKCVSECLPPFEGDLSLIKTAGTTDCSTSAKTNQTIMKVNSRTFRVASFLWLSFLEGKSDTNTEDHQTM